MVEGLKGCWLTAWVRDALSAGTAGRKKTSRPQQDGMFLFEGCYASIFMMFATRMPQGVPMT